MKQDSKKVAGTNDQDLPRSLSLTLSPLAPCYCLRVAKGDADLAIIRHLKHRCFHVSIEVSTVSYILSVSLQVVG